MAEHERDEQQLGTGAVQEIAYLARQGVEHDMVEERIGPQDRLLIDYKTGDVVREFVQENEWAITLNSLDSLVKFVMFTPSIEPVEHSIYVGRGKITAVATDDDGRQRHAVMPLPFTPGFADIPHPGDPPLTQDEMVIKLRTSWAPYVEDPEIWKSFSHVNWESMTTVRRSASQTERGGSVSEDSRIRAAAEAGLPEILRMYLNVYELSRSLGGKVLRQIDTFVWPIKDKQAFVLYPVGECVDRAIQRTQEQIAEEIESIAAAYHSEPDNPVRVFIGSADMRF